ncbi:unnamed protein product [Adineta ricciae]|uniref:Uncharacterized protein n=1 Tax=Adineta ricciae TaxID=249248 RepID=A0A815HNW7_ADIRI|nr:unnamed protein product [Adineta ricciae]
MTWKFRRNLFRQSNQNCEITTLKISNMFTEKDLIEIKQCLRQYNYANLLSFNFIQALIETTITYGSSNTLKNTEARAFS